MKFMQDSARNRGGVDWDESSTEEFFGYYAEQSATPEATARATRMRDMVLRCRGHHPDDPPLDVLDVGCNAGTFSTLWSKLGHRVIGVDINAPLIELARERALAEGIDIDFRVASAADLPIETASVDVCIAPELLEHVPPWEACLDELCRVLRPGGTLYLTTTNKLCPNQDEFDLPFYSWYPGPLKRYYEKLSVTTRPELVRHATYPAVNWFTFKQLRKELYNRGCTTALDRFDIMNLAGASWKKRTLVAAIRKLSILRWVGQVGTTTSIIVAFKAA